MPDEPELEEPEESLPVLPDDEPPVEPEVPEPLDEPPVEPEVPEELPLSLGMGVLLPEVPGLVVDEPLEVP
ncbi:MAG TPA: hypothetical protein VFF81_10885 [Noviherbaspirillum sp.]|nr:hypothetical protein [Noviherbaspirillum sp.]